MLENIYIMKVVNAEKLVGKLVKKCCENIDGNEMVHNDYVNEFNSCTMYIILFAIAFLMIIDISNAYFYLHWYLKRDS